MRRRPFLAGTLAATVLPSSRALARAAGDASSAGTPAPAYGAAIDDLVAANHILAHLGVVDGFGHVSVRDPRDPARYLLARSMAPALVTASDVVTYDLANEALDANGRTSYLERFIHGAIYRLRPDVRSVVHSHAPDVIPFADSSVSLRPVYHMASFLGRGVPVFEIRDAAGPASDMLVSSNALRCARAHARRRERGADARARDGRRRRTHPRSGVSRVLHDDGRAAAGAGDRPRRPGDVP